MKRFFLISLLATLIFINGCSGTSELKSLENAISVRDTLKADYDRTANEYDDRIGELTDSVQLIRDFYVTYGREPDGNSLGAENSQRRTLCDEIDRLIRERDEKLNTIKRDIEVASNEISKLRVR